MAYYTNPTNYTYGYYPPVYQPMAIQQPMIYPQQQTQLIEQPSTQMSPTSMSRTSTQTNDSYFIWVQGEAGAKSYPVPRGTTLPLFDSEGDFVYFKSVDNNGIPLPLVTKVLSDPPVEIKAEVVEDKQIDLSNYVTKEKYDIIAKKYADLENRVLELETKPTSTVTSNFTGNTFNNTRKDGKDNGTKFTV